MLATLLWGNSSDWRRLETLCPFLSQGVIRQAAQHRVGEKKSSYCHAELVSLKMQHFWDLQQHLGLFDIIYGDWLRGLKSVWATSDVGAHSLSKVYSCLLACVSVVEHLDAAVMYPHYASVPWPSHLAYCSSPWRIKYLGFPLSLAPFNCLPLWLYPSHPPTWCRSEVLSRPGDLWLLRNNTAV